MFCCLIGIQIVFDPLLVIVVTSCCRYNASHENEDMKPNGRHHSNKIETLRSVSEEIARALTQVEEQGEMSKTLLLKTLNNVQSKNSCSKT